MNRRTFYLLLFVFVLSGCGMTAVQKQQVAQFGSATEAMGSFAETELVQMREEVIQMNTEEWILNSKKTDLNIELDKPLRLEPTLKRVAAAKALKSYGSLLNKLATADQTASMKKAANDLVVNFSSALDQELTDPQKDAATGLIVSLGNMWIEKMKKDAVKQIVDTYKNDVDKVADLLLQDFSADEDGYIKGYIAVAGDLKNTANESLTQGLHTSFVERERAFQSYVTAKKATQKAQEIDKKAKTVIANLKKANAKLAEVMNKDNYTSEDIKAYAKSIQELVNLVQILTNKK